MASLLQDPLLQWVLIHGHRISEPLELVAALGEKLEANMPGLARFTVIHGQGSLDIGAMIWMWTREGAQHRATSSDTRSRSMFRKGGQYVEEVTIDRQHFREPLFVESPFKAVMDGALEVRRRLHDVDCLMDYPVLSDFRDEGITDYLTLPLAASEGIVHAVSFATGAPGGFSGEEVERLRVISQLLAIAMETIGLRRETVLERRLMDMRVDFMTTLAHEFRTPLATIMLAVDALSTYGDGMNPGQRQDRLQNIAAQGGRLRKLLDEVTEFADGSHKRGQMRPVSIDLERFTRDCVKSQKQLDGSRYSVAVLYNGPATEVRLDLGAWRAILDIVIDNAVKFSPHGGDIEVLTTVTDESLSLRVKDAGIGIPEEDLQHVLAPFYRATNVGVIGGMGLGLSILHGRMARAGGRLELSSTEGEGAEITAILPRSIFEH